MEKIYTIPNISCGHCVNSIKNELTEHDHVERVEGNAEQKTITVTWSSPLTDADIRKILDTINYPAE